jgi:hypothetical protein
LDTSNKKKLHANLPIYPQKENRIALTLITNLEVNQMSKNLSKASHMKEKWTLKPLIVIVKDSSF